VEKPGDVLRLQGSVVIVTTLPWIKALTGDIDAPAAFILAVAAFVVTYLLLSALNIMRLRSLASTIPSDVIYNILIIIVFIPLAQKGLKYRAELVLRFLSRNLRIYGIGSVIALFIGTKAIDLVLSTMMEKRFVQVSTASAFRPPAPVLR